MEKLKRKTPVYISSSDGVVTSYITVFPGKDRDYYMVHDLKFHLSSNIDEWPEYVFLDRDAAQRDAERRHAQRQVELLHWVDSVIGTPETLLFNMFRTWKVLKFPARDTIEEVWLSTPRDVEWKEIQVVSKIREYFGVDIEKE